MSSDQLAAPTGPTFLEFQGLQVAPEAAKREVSGLALPYGEDLDRVDWMTGASKWRFAPGSAQVRDNATLFYGHDHLTDGLPIGRITSHEHTEQGLKITARISETPKGDEVYTLLRDGVLDRFSIGFHNGKTHLEDDDTVLVFDEVDVFETSVVPDPAFKSAKVESVLANTHPKKEDTMPDTLTREDITGLATTDEVNTLSASIDTLERRLATLGQQQAPEGPTVPGSSYGEFLQMAARGDAEATEFLAYLAGINVVDLDGYIKDTWVGERFKFVEAQRTALNFFARSPLPASGMGVEYGIEGTDTTQVKEQLAEGDTLAYGKITFDTDRAPLKTYGGWGDMSRQAIERAPVNVVERFFNALLRRYAQTTEAAVNARTLVAGEALTGGVLDMSTSDGWTRFIIRAARVLKDRGYPIEGILVGFDVFEEVALMRDGTQADAPRFLDRRTGTVNVTGLSGEVFNLPIIPIETGATTDVIRAANSEAIRTYEAGGAPFRLQDDDITNLTKAFSIYGYMADATEVPGAILKPATA